MGYNQFPAVKSAQSHMKTKHIASALLALHLIIPTDAFSQTNSAPATLPPGTPDSGTPTPLIFSDAQFTQCKSASNDTLCDPLYSACRASDDPRCKNLLQDLVSSREAAEKTLTHANKSIAEIKNQSTSTPLGGRFQQEFIAKPPPVVVLAIDKCRTNDKCRSLNDFRDLHKDAFTELLTWCVENGPRGNVRFVPASFNVICTTALFPNHKRSPQSVPKWELVRLLRDAHANEVYSCNGFGVTLPLYSLRRGREEDDDATQPGEYKARGPIESGVGAGYYWALKCRPTWTWGFELFGLTEGLDPSGKFQIGIGGGPSITAFRYFRFGLGLEYDLFRQSISSSEDKKKITSGLLIGRFPHRRNLTWLITFGLQSTDTQTSSPTSSPEKIPEDRP